MVQNTPSHLSIVWKLFLKLVKGRFDDSIQSLKATFSSAFVPEMPAYSLNFKRSDLLFEEFALFTGKTKKVLPR